MLVFRYLFASSVDSETKEARYLAWMLSDMLMRNKIMRKGIVRTSQDIAETFSKDEFSIELIMSKLKANKLFNSLSVKIQKRIIEEPGNWKIPIAPNMKQPSWRDLSLEAKIGNKFSDVQYPLLCSYAHSGSLSLLQIRQADLDHLNNSRMVSLRLVIVAITMMIEGWTLINPMVVNVVKKKEWSEVYENWLDIAKSLNFNTFA